MSAEQPDTRVKLDPQMASLLMLDAMRWRFCDRYGFPVRNQSDNPKWIIFIENSPIRGSGETAQAAVDDAMIQMGVIKPTGARPS